MSFIKVKTVIQKNINGHKRKKRFLLLECNVCGTKFDRRYTKKQRYNVEHFCCYECSNYFVANNTKSIEKRYMTLQTRYGVSSGWLVKDVDGIEKRIKTCLSKYGAENPMHVPSIVKHLGDVKFEKYGDPTYCNVEKMLETKNILAENDPDYWNRMVEKIRKTKLIRYNDPNYNNRESFVKTCQERYGKNNIRMSREVREKMSAVMTAKIMSGEYASWFCRGKHNSTKMLQQFIFRSSWEECCLIYFDNDPDVISFYVEHVKVPYDLFDDKLGVNIKHNYIIDFFVEYADGTQKLIEVKPLCFVSYEINQVKFAAARKYCQENDIIFEVWSDEKINTIKGQIRDIYNY